MNAEMQTPIGAQAPLPSFLAAAAEEQPAFSRAEMMLVGLTQNFYQRQLAVSACFKAIYGDPAGRQFWNVECSQPIPVARFVRLLTVTIDPDEFFSLGRPEVEAQARNLAIGAAVLAISRAHPEKRGAIFFGDTSSLKTAQYAQHLRAELMIDVRRAAECLLGMPKCRHLVPRALAEFIQAPAAQNDPTLPPFNEHTAHALLISLKVSGAHTGRPSREEAQAILGRHYDSVSREQAERLVKKIWGEGKRGPRNSRNSQHENKARTASCAASPRNTPRK